MVLVLSDTERVALTTAAIHERRVRRWRRFQAVLLVAGGEHPENVAANLV